MGKKRLSIREDHDKFTEFQAATGRRNFEFLDATKRRGRVCSRSWQAAVYLDKALKFANEALEIGKHITVVLDTEGDKVNADSSLRKRVRNADGKIVPGDDFYHHYFYEIIN